MQQLTVVDAPHIAREAVAAHMIPLYDVQGHAVGTVVSRPHQTPTGDMYIEMNYEGMVVLMPARRATDVVQPDSIYMLDDGRIWLSDGQTSAPLPVFAEIIRERSFL